jgi:hypothetical protein
MRSMSGWQTIGVVLSVLWIVGSPMYFHFDEYNRDWRHYRLCVDVQTKYFPNPDPEANISAICDKEAFDHERILSNCCPAKLGHGLTCSALFG